jgi:hypothetical protein
VVEADGRCGASGQRAEPGQPAPAQDQSHGTDSDGGGMGVALPVAELAGREAADVLERQRAEQKCRRAAGREEDESGAFHRNLTR